MKQLISYKAGNNLRERHSSSLVIVFLFSLTGMSGSFRDHESFLYVRRLQLRSADLIIYSRTLGQIATVSWSIFSLSSIACKLCLLVYPRPTVRGAAICPSGLKSFLRKRGLVIECYCPLLFPDAPRSCRLVISNTTNDLLAFCNRQPSVCGMAGRYHIIACDNQ